MKRMTRTALSLLTATAASVAVVVAVPSPALANVPAGYVYVDRVQIGDGTTTVDSALDNVNAAIDLALQAAKGATCVPSSISTTIHDPYADVYYGPLDSIYVWDGLVEATANGCPNNTVTVKAKYRDQALDGTSLPAEGDEASGTGKGEAGARPGLMQRYDNLAMATGVSYHTLTAQVTVTQTDGKTTTAACSTKSWTYLATAAGPYFIGDTPTDKVKCGN